MRVRVHARGEVRLVDPEADLLEARGEDDGERGAPAAAADDGESPETIHFSLPPKVETFSVPAREPLDVGFVAADDEGAAEDGSAASDQRPGGVDRSARRRRGRARRPGWSPARCSG